MVTRYPIDDAEARRFRVIFVGPFMDTVRVALLASLSLSFGGSTLDIPATQFEKNPRISSYGHLSDGKSSVIVCKQLLCYLLSSSSGARDLEICSSSHGTIERVK